MKKTYLALFLIMVLAVGSFAPLTPLLASGNYSYRSTVLGTNVRYVSGHLHEIVNQKTRFSTDESVFVLTRIYNISNIDSFKFRHEIYHKGGGKYRELYSPEYYPYRNWWAETYSWNDFGRMPAGSYEIRAYISLNNSSYKHLETKSFTVTGGYYGGNNYQYYPGYNNNGISRYEYKHTYTGTGVSGNIITNQRTCFNKNDNLYALTKLAKIDNVNYFRIKHELYRNGRYYKRQESAIQRPYDKYWNDYFFTSNFGRLSDNRHEVRVYVSIEGGAYKHHNTIRVNRGDRYCDNYYHGDSYRYNYDWSDTDTSVKHVSGYIYRLDRAKTTFNSHENVVVLTKLSKISGVNDFRIRHKLYLNGRVLKKEITSPVRFPGNDYWEYNYTHGNFGKFPAGQHKIKIFISINGGTYRQIGEKSIRVIDTHYYNNYYPYNQSYNYSYNWTKTGTGVYPVHNP